MNSPNRSPGITAPSKRLLLVRHGESTWNAHSMWQGQADPPLSARGEAQAAKAAEALSTVGVDRIISSDLQRATRTGEIIAKRLSIDEVATDPGFREIDVGEWSGLTRHQIETGWPGQRQAWAENRLKSTPGGELLEKFTQRVLDALDRATGGEDEGTLLIIGHSRVISALERVAGVKPVRAGHLSGRWFDYQVGGALVGGDAVNLLDGIPEPTPPGSLML